MIWCRQFMSYGILSHKSFEGSITKVGVIITDDSTRGSEAREDVLFGKLDDNFVIISFAWNGFYPFGHIIHINQYVLVSKWIRKWTHIVIALNIKEFYFENWVKEHHVLLWDLSYHLASRARLAKFKGIFEQSEISNDFDQSGAEMIGAKNKLIF